MSPSAPPRVFDATATASLLPYPQLVDALEQACRDYAAGRIDCPERQVVPLPQHGVMLSMPAVAERLAIHKLVNITPANRERGLPTLHGQVSAYDSVTGQLLLILDGPTVTGRRTAAISLLGLRALLPQAPTAVLLIGTGTQAKNHAEALAALYPGITLYVRGSAPGRDEAFRRELATLDADLRAAPEQTPTVDAVITLTTSRTPVYHDAARAGRLVIGVGAFQPTAAEIAADTIAASRLFVDDPAGARHEAGDLILAGVDWERVEPLVSALDRRPDDGRPIVCKTVGCAAWDLAAAGLALSRLAT